MACRACPKSDDIDAAMAQKGASMRGVGRQFNIPYKSLRDHLQFHKANSMIPNPRPTVAALARKPAPLPISAPQVTAPQTKNFICIICASVSRRAIDDAVSAGQKYAMIAKDHNLDGGVVGAHARNCVPSLLALSADVEAQNCDGNGKPQDARTRAFATADAARRLISASELSPDLRARSGAIQSAGKAIMTLAALTGELKADNEADIGASPKWATLKNLIQENLKPWPEALAAVSRAIREADL